MKLCGRPKLKWSTRPVWPLSVYVNDPMLQASCFLHLPGMFSFGFSLAILLPWLEWPERFPSS